MDRYQVCLGYYWYQAYGYSDYAEACRIHARLARIGYRPARSEEYSAAMDRPENEEARKVFDRLVGGER